MKYQDVDWKQSACTDMDVNVFFPNPGRAYVRKVLEAKAICGECPIVQDCLRYAVDHEDHGIWGGLTAGERKGKYRALNLPVVRVSARKLENLSKGNQQRHMQAASEAVIKLTQALEALGNQAMPEWIEAATLRINNPDKSLTELAEMSNQTKDAYSGKLRRLLAMSNKSR